MKCGKPLEDCEAEFCGDCRRQHHEFCQGRGIFLYDKKMKASVMKYKDGGRREYGKFYGQAMLKYGERELKRWKPQAVLAVPIHPRKRRMRGFDQAGLLAEIVAEGLGIPCRSGYLKKKKTTAPQKGLSAVQRKRNLIGSFEGAQGDWGLQRILLVDDVYTTGSTIDAVSLTAKYHGVKEVYFMTLCIGRGS